MDKKNLVIKPIRDRETSVIDKYLLHSTRKKLLEQAFIQDKVYNKLENSVSSHSAERISINYLKVLNPKPSASKPTLLLKLPQDSSGINPKPMQKIKSPAYMKRNKSFDISKVITKPVRNAMRPTGSCVTAKTAFSKHMDGIKKTAAQFSIKKINVNPTQDFKTFLRKGDEDLCRALIALLCELDSHIKETANYPIQVFLDYINSPGLVVQSIKRIPEYLMAEKIPQKSFISAYEIFYSIETVTKTPEKALLASLLESVFNYKHLPCKKIKFVGATETIFTENNDKINFTENSMFLDTLQENPYSDPVSLNESPKNIQKKNESIEDIPLETYDNDANVEKSDDIDKNLETTESFRDSKKVLLEKFFFKMNKPEKISDFGFSRHGNELRSGFEVEKFDNTQVKGFNQGFQDNMDSIGVESRIFNDNKGNKPAVSKGFKDTKQKIMLGTRFFKKIDEKFIEMMLEKMKKDTSELSELKSQDFEEYTRSKTEYIHSNKEKWLQEVSKSIETSELSNENDSIFEIKHKAMLEYLSQEKNYLGLVLKAEQLELSSRKVNNIY